MTQIVEALWLFLPAAIANGTPVIAHKVPFLRRWKKPMDFGRSYQGIRVLGDNKTWRGLVFGTFAAGLTGYLQHFVTGQSQPASVWVVVAALLGFGALYGDAVESFFKRQRGLPSGHKWFPFDQTDYIIGGLIAVAPLQLFTWPQMAAILIFYFGLHLIVVYAGFRLGLRDKPI